MEYLGYIFGIFGLLAYMEVFPLKKRVKELETTLANMKGTNYYENRSSLVRAAQSYVGQKVNLNLKEDYEDPDIINYGNSKYGSVTILDTDEQWMLIHIESPKVSKDKLIRLEAIEGISVKN